MFDRVSLGLAGWEQFLILKHKNIPSGLYISHLGFENSVSE